MLRFFRQIRQRLLTENKFSKYMLYAIGEILLVVVGILIAIQVDNWNQQRLERINEIALLKNVKKDLRNTIEEFQFLNQTREGIVQASKAIYQMAGDSRIEDKIIDSLISETFYRPTFNNKQGGLDLLFSSGNINLIGNDSIREL